MHCGMHSHSSVVAGGLYNSVYRLGADECESMHRYRSLQLFHQEIGGIIMNGTTTTAITIAGESKADGSCKGTIYHEGGRTWEDAIITATVKIQAKDYQARVKMEENQISLFGGVMCPFLPGYCFDTTLGESVWKSNTPIPCEERVSLLYQGHAELVTNMINQ
ncbi:hypothetical protein JTB14_019806 [Gonioctena quinquepunctata]|nr:hypothetical protein JTB14_019806 [Gonioctena quinquepunctata]